MCFMHSLFINSLYILFKAISVLKKTAQVFGLKKRRRYMFHAEINSC